MANDDEYWDAERLLIDGHYEEAERKLWSLIEKSPRAAQTAILLGVSLYLREKFDKAKKIIDQAYQLKPWVRDSFSQIPGMLSATREARKQMPTWDWPRYQVERNRWRSVGLNLKAAIDFRFANPVSDNKFFFVQVGANDGISGDPIRKVVTQKDLSGLLVEPIPSTFETLKKNYSKSAKLRFANVAITEEDGPVQLYYKESERTTLASMVPERNALRSELHKTKSVTAQGLTMKSLLNEHEITHVDLIQIDTEGYDYHVLRQANLNALNTTIVNMEFYCISIQERLLTFKLLSNSGFSYYFDGMDLLAVRHSTFSDEFCIFESDEYEALS